MCDNILSVIITLISENAAMEATLKETRDELEMDKQTLVCDRASFIHNVLLTVFFIQQNTFRGKIQDLENRPEGVLNEKEM